MFLHRAGSNCAFEKVKAKYAGDYMCIPLNSFNLN